MTWQSKLDDLTERETLIEVDCGDTCVKGVYGGLRRVEIYGHVKWYIVLLRGRRLTKEDLVCPREECERIKVVKC
jgi:hypothetical protein